jgi:hypothetical protein
MNAGYFVLAHASARRLACDAIMAQPDGMVVTIKEPTRSGEQNDKLHALCGEIAKAHEWHGLKLDTEAWKRIFVEAWSRTEGKPQGRLVPSLDGKGIVALGIQTRTLSKSNLSDLIEFIQAWQAEHEVA